MLWTIQYPHLISHLDIGLSLFVAHMVPWKGGFWPISTTLIRLVGIGFCFELLSLCNDFSCLVCLCYTLGTVWSGKNCILVATRTDTKRKYSVPFKPTNQFKIKKLQYGFHHKLEYFYSMVYMYHMFCIKTCNLYL